MSDVIQQARERIKELRESLPPSGPWPPTVGDQALLYAVVEAADAGHLIDARRIEALEGRGDVAVTLEVDGEDGWTVYRRTSWSGSPWQMGYGASAAEALAAAEREAG